MLPSRTKLNQESDYYCVLGLRTPHSADTAYLTADTLKSAYRRALLLNHPDKVADQEAAQRTRGGAKQHLTVDQIAQAYKTLSDPVSRSKYDEDLLKKARLGADNGYKQGVGLETVDLEDLDYNTLSQNWVRQCRCGGTYSVSEHELEEVASEGEVIASCHGCSLCIRITFATVDEDNDASK